MVDLDQVVHSRDDEGMLIPEEVYVKEFDVEGEDDPYVEARPLTDADQEKYIRPFIDAISTASAIQREDVDVSELDDDAREELESMGRDALSNEKLAELFNKKIVKPDLVKAYQANYPDRDIDSLDEEFLDNDLKTGAKDGLFFAILLVSEMEQLVEALRSTVEYGDEPEEADDEDEDEDAEEGNE